MPNEWIIALKKWNEGKETWCLPRKGSKAYDEVRALMPEKKLKASAEPEKAPEPASKTMSIPLKDIMKKKKKPAPPAPPMKIPMEPQRKAFSDSMAPKVKFVEPAPAKKDEPAPKAQVKEKSLYELSPPLVKELKVGDMLNNYRSGGYMGDGGDSRDVGYSYKGKIVKINKDHTIFDIESQKHREPEMVRASLIYSSGRVILGKDMWGIPGAKNAYGGIMRNQREYEEYFQPLVDYFESKDAGKKDKAQEKKMALKESKDYEKMAKDQLLRIYNKWSEANGKAISNIRTAKKDKLIELIKKYNMDE